MKRNSNLTKIEEVLRQYPVLKAICSNPIMTPEKKEKATEIVSQIELSLSALFPQEIKIINLRYFNNIRNKELAGRLDITEQCLSMRTRKIIDKISRIIRI